MKFSEFPYVRPDIDAVCGQINSLAEKFAAAKSAEEELEIIREYRSVLTEFNSTRTIASIRYTINTKDPFYLEENKFFNKNNPIVDKAMVTFGEALLKSSHLDEIKKEFGSIFITNIEFKTKSMNADVIDVGVPVLSMHSPFEVVSKLDVYMAYKGFKAYFEAE